MMVKFNQNRMIQRVNLVLARARHDRIKKVREILPVTASDISEFSIWTADTSATVKLCM